MTNLLTRMGYQLCGLLLAVLAIASAPSFAADAEFSSIKLGDGTKFQTGVFGAKLLAEIHSTDGKLFLVISGVGCQECDANIGIYIHSPADGPMPEGELGLRYSYPGMYIDYQTDRPVERVRMFVGQCLSKERDIVLWLYNSKQESGKWKRWALIARLANGMVVTEEVSSPYPLIALAESAKVAGRCKEIRQRKLYTEP